MKSHPGPRLTLVAIVLGSLLIGCTSHRNLAAEAKVSRAQAEQTALALVPGGTIKEGELEKEQGRLVWSFDIARPGTPDISEIQVDAITGQVASQEIETPEQQAKEAREK